MRSSSHSLGKLGGSDCNEKENKERDHRSGQKENTLFIVGIGPGSPEHMTVRAREAIDAAEVISGYTVYVDLISEFIAGKEIISTAMKKEVDRVSAAIDTALSGKACAIISSGDSGIYAMAGLAFEICREKGIPVVKPQADTVPENGLKVEVIPGIPALASGGSLLGAPLTHDFAVISLSDLLTPWEMIEKRIEHAALADFVIVIFNPKSKKRDWQLKKAMEIVLKFRDENTPVGIVKNAMRDKQDVWVVPLKDLAEADVDMLTTVFIGNSTSFQYLDFMVTPRGYSGKYDIKR